MAAKKAKPGRRKDGRFTKGSTAAKRAGKRGGMVTAKKNASCHTKKKAAKTKTGGRTLRLL